MSKFRFIRPETVRLVLADGEDWVEVKRRLTFGEQNQIATAGLTKMAAGKDAPTEVGIDIRLARTAKLATWLVDWSFQDERGKSVRLTRGAIEALDPETGAEIESLIDEHMEALKAEKKANSGEIISAAVST